MQLYRHLKNLPIYIYRDREYLSVKTSFLNDKNNMLSFCGQALSVDKKSSNISFKTFLMVTFFNSPKILFPIALNRCVLSFSCFQQAHTAHWSRMKSICSEIIFASKGHQFLDREAIYRNHFYPVFSENRQIWLVF